MGSMQLNLARHVRISVLAGGKLLTLRKWQVQTSNGLLIPSKWIEAPDCCGKPYWRTRLCWVLPTPFNWVWPAGQINAEKILHGTRRCLEEHWMNEGGFRWTWETRCHLMIVETFTQSSDHECPDTTGHTLYYGTHVAKKSAWGEARWACCFNPSSRRWYPAWIQMMSVCWLTSSCRHSASTMEPWSPALHC